MATLLNPSLRMQYFHDHCTEDLEAYIPEMQTACHDYWQKLYIPNKPTASTIPRKRTLLEAFLHKPIIGRQTIDEFDLYISQNLPQDTMDPVNLFQWYWYHRGTFPNLSQLALDTLSIPAMSTECERVLSSAQKLITPSRNSLQEDIIEATECLKA